MKLTEGNTSVASFMHLSSMDLQCLATKKRISGANLMHKSCVASDNGNKISASANSIYYSIYEEFSPNQK